MLSAGFPTTIAGLPSSVQPSEVVFVAVAVVGLVIWLRNLREAILDRRAAARDGNGTAMAARFAVRQAWRWITVEVAIIGVGVLIMAFDPNPESSLASRWTIAGVTILVSLVVMDAARDQRRTGIDLMRHARDE